MLALSAVFALFMSIAPAQGDEGHAAAKAVVREFAGTIIEHLEKGSFSRKNPEEREDLRNVFRESFNTSRLLRYVLGRHYWRKLADESRQELTFLFENYLHSKLESLLGSFGGGTESFSFAIVRTRNISSKTIQVVGIVIKRDSDGMESKYETSWLVRQGRILDISMEGASVFITIRDEFQSILGLSGIEGLISLLRKKFHPL